jgi:hypothetical protein
MQRMSTDSLGKMLPRILFPYVQQWAERSGMTLLSRLLVDDQFRGLLEKYGDEIMSRMAQPDQRPPAGRPASDQGHHQSNGNGYSNGYANGHDDEHAEPPEAGPRASEPPANGSSLAKLQERVLAMEAQESALAILRSRMRPLALGLGCCPECLVGVEGCPKCWGQSRVAYYPPDVSLLEAQVINPLAARGVPLALKGPRRSGPRKSSTAARRRSRSWPRK